ncbi:MAG: MFS transporter [Actinomycetota bacterium]
MSTRAEALGTTWKRWTMVAVILGSGVVFLDTSVVNLALPRIGRELKSSLFGTFEAQSYVSNGYFLTLSALLILAGALTDYHGRKRLFSIGLVGFGVTSFLCGIAWNMESLILFRILQGATGAIVVPGSLAIITASFKGEEQGRAFGIWAAASAATTILGPFVGGVLVDSISWRAVFFLNVPFLLVAYLATVRYVPESRDEDATGTFDWLGSLVVVLAVGGLAFGTIRGQQRGWGEPAAYLSLAIGGIAAVAFPIMMKVRRNPLVPLKLFGSRNFTVTNISTFVIYGALYVTFYISSVFLIGTLGYSEPAAGIALLPDAILLTLFSTKIGQLAARYGPRLFMAVGPAVMGLGILLLLRVPAESAPWVLGTESGERILPPTDYFVDILPALLLFGAGLAVMVAPLTTALMTSVPERNSGVASAVNNAISRVGAPLVLAGIFVAVVSSFYGTIAERVPGTNVDASEFRQQVAPLNPPAEGVSSQVAGAAREASTDAFHLAMLVAAGLMFTGAAVNGIGIRNPKREPSAAERKAMLEKSKSTARKTTLAKTTRRRRS